MEEQTFRDSYSAIFATIILIVFLQLCPLKPERFLESEAWPLTPPLQDRLQDEGRGKAVQRFWIWTNQTLSLAQCLASGALFYGKDLLT